MNPPKIENPLFFKLLKEKELIPDGFISDLLTELDGNALDVLATLIQSGIGTKRQLCQLWCDSIGIAHVDLEKSLFQSKVVRKIPERFARQHYAIPIYQMGDTVTVATPIPDNMALKKQIEQIISGPVNLVFALPQDIEWAIENEYQTNSALYEFFTKIATSRVFDAENPISEKTFEKIAGKESINQLHVSLILLGITENASEIQIDPEQDVARVNFIISGQFHERLQIEKNVFRQLVKNIQNMAKITETKDQSPRYSRILFPTPGKKFDIQFLSLPSEFGEKIYLKLMDRAALDRPPRLPEGYLSVRNLHLLRNHLPSPKGMAIICGPTPADYSPLAYAVLRDIRDNNNNNNNNNGQRIMAVEDSPFWLLKNVEQIQVNPKANVSRKDAVTSCLHLHPDVLFVQNIKDIEITEDLKEAAASEAFIIGGIMAEDAIDALYMTQKRLGSVIHTIVHQQMVRRLCEHCKEKYPLSLEFLSEIFVFEGTPKIFAYRAAGCSYCRNTGYQGCIPVQEILVIDSDLREMITKGTSVSKIREQCKKNGFRSREYDGIKKVLQGLTTFDEISLLRSQPPSK